MEPLRNNLILHMHAGGPDVFKDAYRTVDMSGFAVSGPNVDHQRDVYYSGDPQSRLCHLPETEGRFANTSENTQCIARLVETAESNPFSQPCRKRIVGGR